MNRPRYCSHYDCQIDALQFYNAAMKAKGTVLTEAELQQKMRAIQASEVVCRKVPRGGAVDAPFPGEA